MLSIVFLAKGPPHQLTVEDSRGFGRQRRLSVTIWVCFQGPVSRHSQLLARSRSILKLTGLMDMSSCSRVQPSLARVEEGLCGKGFAADVFIG